MQKVADLKNADAPCTRKRGRYSGIKGVRNMDGEWRFRTPEQNAAIASKLSVRHSRAGVVLQESAEQYAERNQVSVDEARHDLAWDALLLRNMHGLRVIQDQEFPIGPSIYFIEADGAGLIKIGYSSNVRKRFDALQGANANLLRLLATMPGDLGLERRLHQQFAAYRRRGEWFQPSDGLRAYVAKFARTPPCES